MTVLLTLMLVAMAAWIARLQERVSELEGLSWRNDQPARDYSEPVAEIIPAASVTAVSIEASPVSDDEPGAPTAEAIQDEEAPLRESIASTFERVIGGHLLIWAGGIAMAIAGVFLVRYSIEIGLITPAIRMGGAAAFGLALVSAGLAADRFPRLADDPRVAQSLTGAGIAVLYATIYGASALYGLIGDGVAFLLMAALTLAALLLALRRGIPIAVLGLVGGFATPLLMGSESATVVPLLVYLGLLDVALFMLAIRRGWWWLALGAIVGSLAWTVTMVSLAAPGDAVAAGLFVALLGIAAATVFPSGATDWRRYAPAGLALLQLAILVARVDIGWQAWALYGLLTAAALVLSLSRPRLLALPAATLGIALLLLGIEASTAWSPILPIVAIAITLVHAAAAGAGLRGERTRTVFALVGCAALAAPAIELRAIRPELLGPGQWAVLLALVGLAAIPFLIKLRGAFAAGVLLPIASSAVLIPLMMALHDALPLAMLPSAWLALAALATIAFARIGGDGPRIAPLVVAAAALLVWPIADPSSDVHLLALFVAADPAPVAGALKGLAGPALLLGLLAWLHRSSRADPVLIAAAALFAAMLVTAPLDPLFRPFALATIFAALVELSRHGASARVSCEVALVAALLWMWGSVLSLVTALGGSIAGQPVLVTDLPSATTALAALALPLPLLAAGWWRGAGINPPLRTALLINIVLAAGAALYIFAKQPFAIASAADFVRHGFAERTILTQTLFAAGAWLLAGARFPGWLDSRLATRIGLGLMAVAAARFVWFDLLLLNPALVPQSVGALPVANLISVAYFGAVAWFWRLRTGTTSTAPPGLWLGLFLAALLMGAGLAVRQLFAGAILVGPPPENLEFYAYSAAALLLSIALLAAGTRRGDQPIRVAGLALLAATVVKVFAIDAAALDGLLRILSFIGLGAALIGVGMLYTRLLRAR